MAKGIKFVLYDNQRTTREKNLLDADVRAHAATVAHARNRRSSRFSTEGKDLIQRFSIDQPWHAKITYHHNSVVDIYDPWQLSRGYRKDPFECVPGTNEGVQASAFEYLTGYLFPSGDAISSAYGTSNWWRKLVIAMAQSAEVSHAVTCVLAATHAMVVKDATPDGFRHLSPGILYHRGQAIRTLRLRLLQPGATADDCAILAVLFLGIFDKGVGDDVAAAIHWRQFSQMVAARGGPQNITSDLGLRDILVTFQQLSGTSAEGFSTTSASIEPMVVVPQHYSSNTSDGLRTSPVSFQEMFLHGSLCQRSMDVVLRLRREEHLTVKERQQRLACERTLNEEPDLFVPQKASLLEKLVSLALLRYRVNTHTRVRHFVCPYEQAAWTLSEVLPRVVPPSPGLERSTLLWVWLVAVDAWSVSTTLKTSLTDRGRKLFRQMAEKFPEIRCWEDKDFMAVGHQFFWYKRPPRWLAWEWGLVKSVWRFI